MSSGSSALTEAVYYILLSLHTPLHGYGIMQHVETLSKGRVKLAAGTLYGALGTMTEKGWIRELSSAEYAAERKKEYCITATGKEIALQELKRLNELVHNGEMIIGGKHA